MAKQPAPTSPVSWWLNPPPVDGWTRHCSAQFDVRLSRKLGTGITIRANAKTASAQLGVSRSQSVVKANAGIRRNRGFGISERHR